VTIDAEAITDLSSPPASVRLSSPAKDKGHVAPPTLTSLGSIRQAPPKPAMVDQEETPVQPKCCGHPPKAGKSYVFLGSFFQYLLMAVF